MKALVSAALAAAVGLSAAAAEAAENGAKLPDVDWSFSGIFGTFDRAAAQRGLQVYNQVCASCHSLEHVAFRTLTDIGYSEDQVKAIAAQFTVTDGPNDSGEMYERPAEPADHYPPPFPNDQAARVANGGALPPDLSVITQARPGGPDYLYALLVGYGEPPADHELRPGIYWNEYFPGNEIGMPPPLQEGIIEYQDGTPATTEQMARDVTTFLHWAAEPNMEERKRMGIKVVLFLLVLTGLLYALKRKIWQDVH